MISAPSLWAVDYHVDQSSPEITEDGSTNFPFKTISQASAVMSPGDTCHIHRGIYRETINPQSSGTATAPLRYVGYGNDAVVVSGTTRVTGWQPHSGSIYKASNVDMLLGDSNMVYFGNQAQQLARWPNDTDGNPYTFDAHHIQTTAGTYSDSFIAHDSIPDYWTSGVIHWLGAHSGCAVQRAITGYDTGTHRLSFTPFPNFWPFSTHSPTRLENGHRGTFFLLNRLEALDAPGEWFYDAPGQTLYFYAPDGVDPTTGTVEVATRLKTIHSTRNYIHFEKLNLFGGAVRLDGHNNRLAYLRVRNAVAGLITDHISATAGGEAVLVSGDNNQIEHCLIEEGSAMGVNIWGNADNTIVENNIIRNFDTLGNHTSPIRSNGPGTLITRNRISGSSRDCARSTGTGSIFSYNEVFDGLLTCTDGGLFYVTGNSTPANVELHHNWFHDAYSPTSYTSSRATGIYLDNDSTGYKVHHNVVWNIQWGGLHFNWDAWFNEIYNNTFWNVGTGEAMILSWIPVNSGIPTDVRDNTLINNLSDVRQWWDSGAGGMTEDETLDNIFTNNIQVPTSPFVSISNKDFMTTNNSSIVDQGNLIPGITDGYSGAAPDIGAYEFGGYRWTPRPDWEPASFEWSLPPVPNPTRKTLIADNFNPRLTSIFGTPDTGTIQFRSNGPHSATLPSSPSPSPWTVDFQWTGLDLDGVGGTDDTIYFSLAASGSINGFASTSNIQAGNSGWGALNAILDAGESMDFKITDVSVSAGTSGSVVFDGFTSARLIKLTPIDTGVAATGTVNSVVAAFASTDAQYITKGASFNSPTHHVVLACTGQDGINLAARDFDLQFTYEPPQTETAPQLLLSADNFNPRNGVIFPSVTGGASTGSISFDPTGPNLSNIPVSASVSPSRVDFVWAGLDLDGYGGTDDAIYFTLVATSSTGASVIADSTGWGAEDTALNPGERLTYRIEDIRLSAGTGGSVKFDGFTGGRMVNRNYPSGLSATGTVNGVASDWLGTGAANTYLSKGLHSTPIVENLVFAGGASTGINLAVRDFDFQFSYYAAPATSTFAQWRSGLGLLSSDGAGDADPDGDGFLNINEYALDGNPLSSADGGIEPGIQSFQNTLEFTHLVRNGAQDLEYLLELSETLAPGSWVNAGFSIKSTTNLGNVFSEVINEVPTDTNRIFMRLRIKTN